MLSRSNFVVLCLCKNAKLPKLLVEISHIFSNSWLDRTEVVVVHFLSLRRHSAEEGTTCHDQVFSLLPHLTVNEEVFLLGTNRGLYTLDLVIAKEFKYTDSLLVESFH